MKEWAKLKAYRDYYIYTIRQGLVIKYGAGMAERGKALIDVRF